MFGGPSEAIPMALLRYQAVRTACLGHPVTILSADDDQNEFTLNIRDGYGQPKEKPLRSLNGRSQ